MMPILGSKECGKNGGFRFHRLKQIEQVARPVIDFKSMG